MEYPIIIGIHSCWRIIICPLGVRNQQPNNTIKPYQFSPTENGDRKMNLLKDLESIVL
jgi:hypothetical protein